jgi:serine/threonine protein kinase
MLIEITEAIQGQRQSWNLIKKLGEGDAGEVYLVESVLGKQPAIVKRPRRGSFFSDILRQANQIKTEGSILKELPRVAYPNIGFRLSTPALIDQNKLEYEQGEGTFIIIEQVKGFTLKILSQLIRFGPASLQDLPADQDSAYFIEQWAQQKQFPAQLIVRVLLGVLTLLEAIHTPKLRNAQGVQSGVIWNDVKPEHLYWDPSTTRLTVIDWGNSQFLESSGVTKDRQYSAADDYRQMIQEMGGFLAEANPELYAQLEWPEFHPSDDLLELLIRPLKDNLVTRMAADSEQLQALRRQETDLYSISRPGLEHIAQYQELSQQFSDYGEVPDNFGALNFMFTAAYQMASEYKLSDFQKVCESAARLPATTADKWNVLVELAEIAGQTAAEDDIARTAFANALTSGVAGDWTAALWELFTLLADAPRPEWWEKISQEIRKVCLGLEPEAISPYTLFARMYYTLQAEVSRKGNHRLTMAPEALSGGEQEQDDDDGV